MSNRHLASAALRLIPCFSNSRRSCATHVHTDDSVLHILRYSDTSHYIWPHHSNRIPGLHGPVNHRLPIFASAREIVRTLGLPYCSLFIRAWQWDIWFLLAARRTTTGSARGAAIPTSGFHSIQFGPKANGSKKKRTKHIEQRINWLTGPLGLPDKRQKSLT